MTSPEPRHNWGRPFRVGDRIIEKQRNSDPRVVESIVEGSYLIVRGVLTGRRTRISWLNLNRYRLHERQS